MGSSTDSTGGLAEQVTRAVFGAARAAEIDQSGPRHLLPSVFDVTDLAAATIGAATLAAADVAAARTVGPAGRVAVDRRAACAAFLSERLFTPVGWDRPAAWDPIAGDYPAADGWVRLHTNYAHHRAAVERVLLAAGREAVAAAVAQWRAEDLESAVVAAGGCAAALHDRAEWLALEAGQAAAGEPPVRVAHRAAPDLPGAPAGPLPFSGLRVLDLTRVIAGPVCTRFLAGYGADVLRLDPPGFAEVPALVPDMTVGKRCAALDLATDAGRAVFADLVRGADVLVSGLRPGALPRRGLSAADLHELNPSLITASLDAYGWTGPWRERRGFDSLVQLSTGIAAAGARASGRAAPVALPAQALDHATGYLLAAAVGAALAHRGRTGEASDITASLVATANLLLARPVDGGLDLPAPHWTEQDTVAARTHWGAARQVPLPGGIGGVRARWSVDAGPTGRDDPRWRPRA